MLEVHGLKPAFVMLALLPGLRARDFFHSFFKKFSCDVLEFLSRFEKYINAEEGMMEKRKERGEHNHPQESCPLLPLQPKKQSNEVKSCCHTRNPRCRHYDEFTPLDT